MTAQTLEQKRAKHALDQVKVLETEGRDRQLRQLRERLAGGNPHERARPGAGDGMRRRRDHRTLANHVSNWLLREEARTKYTNPVEGEGSDDSQRLLSRIVEGGQDAYVWAQGEAIAYVTWLKKFANAFLESSERE